MAQEYPSNVHILWFSSPPSFVCFSTAFVSCLCLHNAPKLSSIPKPIRYRDFKCRADTVEDVLCYLFHFHINKTVNEIIFPQFPPSQFHSASYTYKNVVSVWLIKGDNRQGDLFIKQKKYINPLWIKAQQSVLTIMWAECLINLVRVHNGILIALLFKYSA